MSTVNYNDTHNLTFSHPNDQLESLSYQVRLSKLVLLMLISVLTILGNTLVLVATWSEKSLHEPNKYFIACLAVADLLVGVVAIPVLFYQSLNRLNREKVALIPALCNVHIWTYTFAATASIYTLTFISFDRYLKLSKPLHYKSRMTTSTSFKVIFIIFLISTVYATFSIIPAKDCNSYDKKFYTFFAVAAFFLPLMIMMIMYTLIFLVAHKRHKMLRNGELGQTFNERTEREAFLQDLKIIRMLVIVVGVFSICWGPLFIWLMLLFYTPELFHTKDNKFESSIGIILPLLSLMNSLCNPIIYACLDQKYKQAFKRVYQKLMRRSISEGQESPNAIELRNVNQLET